MQQCYHFGRVEVRPAERRILVDGEPVHAGSRAFDVLLTLIEHRDRVVTKNELLDRVWPGLIVEENNLQVQVSTLRKILGANALTTIAGHGYRLTTELDNDGEQERADYVPKHNLPASLNSFVGREREIGEVLDLLVTMRLVTLTGMGGTGKTRLLLQVAQKAAGEYPDGVWLVELASIADAQMVPHAVASALGVKQATGRTLLQSLEAFVRDQSLLLLLDNCEHVRHACAELAKQLLRAGHGIQILATCRDHLHVTGESNFHVPSLALPDRVDTATGAAVCIDDLAQCEAVRLFVDRATAAKPGFRLTTQNATSVIEICRRLDGIPLSIELAAARVDAMSMDKIAARLGDRFRLLTGGDCTAPPHQQTLRASIDWSHGLLTVAEQCLLRLLAVFSGGWTLEAAEAICAGECPAGTTVLEHLSQLVEKSFVNVDADGERYQLHATIRHYAWERLAESGEETATRDRHLHHYLQLAEQARTELTGPAQGSWLARLDTERQNHLSAHAWADHAEQGAELGLRLVWALKPYWLNRGYVGLAQRATAEALTRPGAEARTLARCRALFDAGQVAVLMGQCNDATGFLMESLAIARELGERRRIAMALQPLGMDCLGRGDIDAARDHLQEALEMAQALGDKRELAAALSALAQLFRVEGALDSAEPLYRQALQLSRDLQDRESIAISLLNLAIVTIDRGTQEPALPMLCEVLDIAEETGSKRLGQCAMDIAAGLATLRADWKEAAQWYGAAAATAEQTGLQRDTADEAFLKPHLEAARTALPAAAFAAAVAAGHAMPYRTAMDAMRGWLEGASRIPSSDAHRATAASR